MCAKPRNTAIELVSQQLMLQISSETKHQKRTTMQPTVELSTFSRNTEERKLWQRPQFTFQLPSTWSDISVLQEAKPFCRRLLIKSPKTTISLSRTSEKRSLKLLSYVGRPIVLEMKHLYQLIYAFHRILIRTSSLKPPWTPVPGKHTPNEVLRSNVPAEPS